jgi:hypothetical protein
VIHRVRRRIILAMVPLVIAVLASAGIGVTVSWKLLGSAQEIASDDMPSLRALRDAQVGLARVRFVTTRAIVVTASGHTGDVEPLWLQRQEALGRAESGLAEFARRPLEPEEVQLLTQVQRALADFLSKNEETWAELRRGDVVAADRIQSQVATWIDDDLFNPIRTMVDEQQEQAEASAKAAADAARLATELLAALGLATVIAAAAIGLVLYRTEAQLVASSTTNARLISELRDALDKSLAGMLPMCMYCKRIRDDQGSWDRIEKYLSKRTDATVSHGMCPDCYRAHFPEPAANDPKSVMPSPAR